MKRAELKRSKVCHPASGSWKPLHIVCDQYPCAIHIKTNLFPGDWEKRTLQNSHQFYKWYSELTALRRQQIEGDYGEYLAALSQRLQVAEGVTTRVDRSIDALSSLQSNCTVVCSKAQFPFPSHVALKLTSKCLRMPSPTPACPQPHMQPFVKRMQLHHS